MYQGHFDLAMAYLAKGELEDYKEVGDMDQSKAEFMECLTVLNVHSKEFGKEMELLNRFDITLNLGIIYLNNKEFPKSKDYFEKSIKCANDISSTLQHL